MTTFAQFATSVKAHLNMDPSDDLITSWVRMAEERISNDLRVRELVRREVTVATGDVAALPPSCNDIIYIRYVADTESQLPFVRSGRPLAYVTPDEYWRRIGEQFGEFRNTPSYTLIGTNIHFSPFIDVDNGLQLEIGFYGDVPPLTTTDNAFYTKYPTLTLYAVMAHAFVWGQEDDRAAGYVSLTTGLIESMNQRTREMVHGGSPLKVRSRSFG